MSIIRLREKDKAPRQKTDRIFINSDSAQFMWGGQIHINAPLSCIIRLIAKIEQGAMIECPKSQDPVVNYVGAVITSGDTVRLDFEENGQNKLEEISIGSLLRIKEKL